MKARAASAAKVAKLDGFAKDPAKALADVKGKADAAAAALAVPGLNSANVARKSAELKGLQADLALLQSGALATTLADAKTLKAKADGGVTAAPFPMKNPGVFSIGGAFLVGIVVSLLKREKEAEDLFESEKVRTFVGIGAEGAAGH